MEKKRKLYIETLGIIQATSNFSLEESGYSRSEEANALIFNDSFSFITGLIFDQNIQSSLAWEAPFLLRERLGHIDARKIALMDKGMLKRIIAQEKSLHRYPGNMAKYLIESCSILVSDFDCRAENLWECTRTIAKAKRNFLRLSGIGEKKANLAILMLARDFKVHFADIGDLPLALDIHLKRVLCRSGLFAIKTKSGLKDLRNCFQKNYPQFPALLGTTLWFIGRRFCYKFSPQCDICPLNRICSRRLI